MEADAIRTRLINLRESQNLSQVELGKRIGINNTIINKIESGTRAVSAEELGRFADFYGVTSDYIRGANHTPEWATTEDVADLKQWLDDPDAMNTFNFGGNKLSDDEKAKLQLAVTQIFWDKLKQRHKGGSAFGN
ncbi:helix-turn-helix domain-containing protein [Lacticaseibacillus parakribbianus]|uniref:helix-turn-helix domain-containing protein n=1 Tax=Lacticaseibacillus parakribbianus TaxID=2970927 RepID=UPI0021CB6F79|nr:helix-turn-helix transcriptional regulator [Lacticaseibacillus parakribbianus]